MHFPDGQPQSIESIDKYRNRIFELKTGWASGLKYYEALALGAEGCSVTLLAGFNLDKREFQLPWTWFRQDIPILHYNVSIIILSLEKDLNIHSGTIDWDKLLPEAQKETGLPLLKAPWDTAASLLLTQRRQIPLAGSTYPVSEPFDGFAGHQSVFMLQSSLQHEGSTPLIELSVHWTDDPLDFKDFVAFRLATNRKSIIKK